MKQCPRDRREIQANLAKLSKLKPNRTAMCKQEIQQQSKVHAPVSAVRNTHSNRPLGIIMNEPTTTQLAFLFCKKITRSSSM